MRPFPGGVACETAGWWQAWHVAQRHALCVPRASVSCLNGEGLARGPQVVGTGGSLPCGCQGSRLGGGREDSAGVPLPLPPGAPADAAGGEDADDGHGAARGALGRRAGALQRPERLAVPAGACGPPGGEEGGLRPLWVPMGMAPGEGAHGHGGWRRPLTDGETEAWGGEGLQMGSATRWPAVRELLVVPVVRVMPGAQPARGMGPRGPRRRACLSRPAPCTL